MTAVRGRSKEKRCDCRWLHWVWCLTVAAPRSSRVFAGNASEPATLETMVTSLAGAKASALIVMDAGIATEARSSMAAGTKLSLPGGQPQAPSKAGTRNYRKLCVYKARISPDLQQTE
ncbi:MAG: hypothetical protein IPP22_06985 [Nitrosomonas sp.]|nr:hypothetical protein [Nitrosomonas sp.]